MVHPTVFKSYEEYKSLKRRENESAVNGEPSSKKCKAETKHKQSIVEHVNNKKTASQAQIDNLVIQYIVSEMRPLSTVEKPAFKALVECASGKSVMCRTTLTKQLNSRYESMINSLIENITTISHICTTADIWSVNNQSYMGVTGHWIDGSLVRHSVALACRRMVGSHTYDKIAEVISEVHASFGIEISKLTHTVTDGASNFRKAFEVFKDSDEEEEVQFIDIGSIIESEHSGGDSEAQNSDVDAVILPKQQRCVSHSLNLIASSDAGKAKSTSTYSRQYNSVMGKCQAIWNSVHRSSKASDAVKDICRDVGKGLLFPCPTRWNSMFDAVCRVLELKDKLNDICSALDLPKFKPSDIDFLTEYSRVLQPLASTLDTLQGEHECFYGMLLPKLIQLRHCLSQIQLSNLIYCEPLASAIVRGLQSRFGSLLQLEMPLAKHAVLAAIAHPHYKLRWIPPDDRESLRSMFVQAVGIGTASTVVGELAAIPSSDEDDYGYSEMPSDITRSHAIETEVSSYLADPDRSLTVLNKYPLVKSAFIKFNTTLPSSAAVERLFSVGGQIETARRNRLSDGNFEKLLLLKANTKEIAIA